MRMLWCLLGFSLVLLHAEGRSTNNNNNNGHPLDNDKWLSDVSQYDKDRYWNKFRDEVEEDYFRTWSPSKPVEQDTEARRGRRTEPVSKTTAVVAKWRSEDGVDGTKDPCMKVRCPPHKVCITHDYQTAVCTNHRQPPHSVPPVRSGLPHKRWMGAGPHGRCPACPLHHSSLVCGSDGHTYASKCKLEFQACTMGKTISMKCEGPCPCLPGWETVKHKAEKNVCNDKELRNLASRLKDWFGILHKDANRDLKSAAMSDAGQGRFDTSILPICKDSLGWMFNKLDMNYDLLLDNTELSAIYLDKHELCLKPLFNSCDSFKDGKLSNNEWCYCFQKPDGLPCQNEMKRIQSQGRRKSLLGTFIPRCNDEGYFKPTQCHGSQCWCVDKYGNEIAGSRKQGNPACEEDSEGSGDLGSGAVVLLDDQEEEQHAPNPVRRLRPRGADEDDEEDEDDQESDWGLFY